MSDGPFSAEQATSRQPTEDELRAYEEELSRITAGQILLQTAASLISIAGRRLGLAEHGEQERDLQQACDAIDGARALLPIVERRMPAQQLRPLRDALSQLQMAYAQLAQQQQPPPVPAGGPSEAAGAQSGGPQSAAAPAGAPGAGGAGGPAGAPGTGTAGGPAGPPGKGTAGEAGNGESDTQSQRGPGPAQRSGRLWVPGSS